jgi:hypothetical protein
MAQLVIAAAGAAIGGATLGTGIVAFGMSGVAIGWAAGSMLGSMLQKGPNQQGPRLGDLRVSGTEYGQTIPWVSGSPRIAGQIVWASNKREIANTQKVGKGGGGSRVTTYTYEVDLLVLLTENEIAGVSRIWSNGELVYGGGRSKSGTWAGLTIYNGTDTQMPDPTYEAAVGAGNAPAYRGRGYVVIRSLQLGQSGQIPNLTFEIGAQEGVLDGFSVVYPQGIETQNFSTLEEAMQAGNALGSTNYGWGKPRNQYLGYVMDALGSSGPSYFPDGNRIDFSQSSTTLALLFTHWGSLPPLDLSGNLIQSLPSSVYVQRSVSSAGDALRVANFTDGSVDGILLNDSCGLVTPDFSQCGWRSVWRPGGSATDADPEFIFQEISPAPPPTINVFAARVLAIRATFTPWAYVPFDQQGEAIDGVCNGLMERAGYDAGDYDTDALANLTKPLRALAIGQVSPTRGTLETLQQAWYFEASKSDRIYLRPRAVSPVATIPWADLGVGDGAQNEQEPLALRMGSDLEIPAQVSLSYHNIINDYNISTEHSDRLISGQASTATVQMPLGMLPAEAKGVADALLFDQLASLTSTTIRLPLRYAFIEPGDVIEVVNFDGRSYRLRVVAKRDTLSILEMECVLDDVGALQSATVTDGGYISVAEPVRVAPTVFQALDIPILRDADNDAGYYAAVAADRESAADQWDGAVFVQAFSADAFEQAFVTAESGIIGECLTTLGNWTGGNVFDESSTLDVEVVGELASSTRDLMLADLSINAMLVGHEIIRFRLATLLNAEGERRTYRLMGLLRGQRGTEWAMGQHLADERCVLLNPALRRVAGLLTQIGLQRNVKGVTLNTLLSDVADVPFTNNAVGLRPFAPANVVALADGANLRIKWQRRTRLEVKYGGEVGQVVPLGEGLEQYRVRIFDGPTLVRTATVTTPEYLYTQLTADGFASGDPVTVDVAQISATVGPGYATTTTGTAP